MTRTHDEPCDDGPCDVCVYRGWTPCDANYIDGDCGCWCHGQVEGQESLIPDPRTTTEVPF